MGKKLKGGRRQILQLEEKKPPKVPSKSKVKSLIHYSDSDDDSKKSNESESSPSAATQNKDATPLESQIADFFKEIDALSVPDELLEEPDKATSSSKAETVNENVPEACSSDTAVDLPASASKDDKHSDASSKEKAFDFINASDINDKEHVEENVPINTENEINGLQDIQDLSDEDQTITNLL
ncbi:hypothetical protein AVEN_70449-1 [Araneus ventricosus]|uniref:Uncharacterized protein n=1 Tax=Araneus ventricosus TaxID=182803 RepID=A0A4Y2PA60_ARAVE|nr:hypothetical protein AVEN_70449-1 [Araneus ventricosus]